MSSNVRNVLITAGFLTVYAFALWLYESKALDEWTREFRLSTRARLVRDDRESLITEEMTETPDGTD